MIIYGLKNTKNLNHEKLLLFFGGFVSGVVAVILVVVLINIFSQSNDGFPGLTRFSEKGECIAASGDIRVMQVLAPNVALAWTQEMLLVLLIDNDGKSYYDGQRITIPYGKCARQIGTYRYTTKDEFEKTVPAVVIE